MTAAAIESTETSETTEEYDEENPTTNRVSFETKDRIVGKPTEEPSFDVGGAGGGGGEDGIDDIADADDAEDDGPVDGVGCQQGCARDRHLILTSLSIGLLVVPLLLAAKVLTTHSFMVIESILGAFYLFFVFRSNTFQYLLNINTTDTVRDYMNQMYRTEPVINWFIQCYHFEQKSRQVATAGPNGTTIYTTEYYQERVNTHSARGQLAITSWTDVSIPLDQSELEAYNMTKVSIKKTWIGDEGAMAQKQNFICTNKRDVYYEFVETLDLVGYRSRFLGFADLDNVPPLAHWGWYLASHLTVVFGVPYRMWLSSKSHKVRTAIVKQVWTS